MESALSWIGQFFDTLALFIPRRVIIRTTQRGIKWRGGRQVFELKPGIHWFWPFTTEMEHVTVARQNLGLPDQTLFTKDRHQIVVSAVVTYKITDVILAYGERNWNLDETLRDISRSAVVDVVSAMTLDELQTGVDTTVTHALTQQVRLRLRRYGASVVRCALTDFATCKVYKVLGSTGPQHGWAIA